MRHTFCNVLYIALVTKTPGEKEKDQYHGGERAAKRRKR
jgi:hypothetical protein